MTAVPAAGQTQPVTLPAPDARAGHSLEQALRTRRSVRAYRDAPLTLAQVSQLLWAAQGVTGPEGQRTAPSAGALYPLELYLVAGRVEGLAPGVYRYRPRGHDLLLAGTGERRAALAAAALGQDWMAEAAAVVVFAAVIERTTGKYGQRGVRYVYIEVGHAAENLFLQARALGLGAAVVGAFDDERVSRLVGLAPHERALYLMPVGPPR